MSDEFSRFWDAWPPNKGEYTRKVNKAGCRKKWQKEKLDRIADVIIEDVTKRKRYDAGWLRDGYKFLCAPLAYLNQRRWEDGEFADIRDQKRRSVAKPSEAPVDEARQMSRYARYANKLLLKLAYGDPRRGFRPIAEYPPMPAHGYGLPLRLPKATNDSVLRECLRLKREICEAAEQDEAAGEKWTDEEFISVIRKALETQLIASHRLKLEDLRESAA